MTPEFIGYDQPVYAIIGWYENDIAKHKTYCYNEEEVQMMLKRHRTPGDTYSTKQPKIHLIGGPLNV